eukprot:gene19887-22601_t
MDSAKDMEELLMGLQQMKLSNPEVFKQAMQSLGLPTESENASMLDENDSLLKMAEAIKMMKKPNTDEDMIGGNDLIMSKDKPKQPKGITITPSAGFSYKTSRVADGLKVFINMAQHELIDAPAIKKKLDDKGEEVEGMNIPMSVGQPRFSEDKKGAKCVVYDIIVNPIVVTEATADKTGKYRDFICQLGMQYLEQKYKEELDKRYKLPKLKYMGSEIATQLIQDRKSMPKIEEVSSKSASKSTGKAASKSEATKAVVEIPDKDLQYTLSWLIDKTQQSGSTAASLHYVPGTQELSPELHSFVPYEHQVLEYLDPIYQPSANTVAIVVSVELPSYELSIPNVRINISPYKISMKFPGYKNVTLHLACVVQPNTSFYTLRRPYEGCLSAVQVQVVLCVDHADWAESADAGSKAWLLSQALGDGEENPYGISTTHRTSNIASNASNGDQDEDDEDEPLAEDKFHLNLPDDVDAYTGLKLDGDDPFSHSAKKAAKKPKASLKPDLTSGAAYEDSISRREENVDGQELPEDRFHKKDASSAYLINQREQAKKDKWTKHEQEKKERANDPNVEYVDMDDF